MACMLGITWFSRSYHIKLKINPIASFLSTKNYIFPFVQYRSFNASLKCNNENKKPFYSTNIILQDGISLLEMPCIVQILNCDFRFMLNEMNNNDEILEGLGQECPHITERLLKKKDFKEDLKVILKFMRCSSLKEVVNLYDESPVENITPPVALAIIRRIFDFEQLNYEESKNSNSSVRLRTMKQLSDIICSTNEPQLIVDCLRSLSRDPQKLKASYYFQRICDQGLILASNGKLTTEQVCDLIKALYNLGEFGEDYADKAWVGINEDKQITADDICKIMKILECVKYSRIYLYNIVEKRVPLVLYQLTLDHILEILYSLVKLNLPNNKLLQQISRWVSQNVFELTTGNMRWIIASFLSLNYTDENIQHSLSRLLITKENCIEDNSLVTQIMEYCHKMRIRHPTILSFTVDYFLEHSHSLSASDIASIMNCLGYLNYLPKEPHSFFSTLETRIDEKFAQFDPSELINLFLSCVYLERYPLNFVKKVFHSDFLDKIHSSNSKRILDDKEKLLILNSVLTKETLNYEYSILPRKFSARAIEREVRIMRIMNRIRPTLVKIIGNEDRIYHSVVIPSLPQVSLFVIDVVVDMKGKFRLSKFKFDRRNVAFLILLPEHFDITEKFLIGPQVMKKRVLEKLDFKVIHLKYKELNKLYMYPDNLKLYIEEEMKKDT